MEECLLKLCLLRECLPTLLKLALLHGCFSRFLNCANGTESRNASHFTDTDDSQDSKVRKGSILIPLCYFDLLAITEAFICVYICEIIYLVYLITVYHSNYQTVTR